MQYRIIDLPQVSSLTENMPLETADMREPNAANQSRKLTLGQLRDFIMGSVPAPTGAKWVSRPTVTVNASNPYQLDVSAGEAEFDQVAVLYEATSFTVSEPALQRFDLIYATPQGTYGIETGDESSNPALPNYPEDSLYVGHALINSTGGEVQEPPTYVTLEQVQALLGDYLKLNNPQGAEVRYGTDGSLEFYENGFDWEDYGADGASYYFNGETSAYIPGKGFMGAIMRMIAVYGANQAAVYPYYGPDGGGVMLRVNAGEVFHELDFRSDGKLYLNGVEFTGGGGSGVSTFDALTDTPATKVANKWLKVNAGGTALEYTDAPSGGGTLYASTGQATDGAMTQKAATDSFAQKASTGALAVAGGAMTVPLAKDGVYYAASYPTSITVDTTNNALGVGAVCKITANGTTAPTVSGATKHNSSANFNTTNGTSNTLRVWCEYNASNVKTNYFIWTQQ